MTLKITLVLSAIILSLSVNASNKAEVFRRSANSVVLIVCIDNEGEPVSTGTGSLIRGDGTILTNNHVVTTGEDECPLYAVYFKPEKLTGSNSSRVVGSGSLSDPAIAVLEKNSELFDLALLKVSELPEAAHPILVSSDQQEDVGSEVIAIGHPGGGSVWSLTSGTISSAISDYRGVPGYDVYQTDAALNPGNSGGPLINSNGFLVGVNSFISRGSNEEGITLDGLGFAAQISTVYKWLGEDYFSDVPEQINPQQKNNDSPLESPNSKLNEHNLDEWKLTRFLDYFVLGELEREERKSKKDDDIYPEESEVDLNIFLDKLGID